MNIERESPITSRGREKQGLRLFMIVKPDGGRYLTEIE